MNIRRLGLYLALLCFLGATNSEGEDWGATARGMFALLPTSLFESTPEGMSEGDKQDILTNGHSENWEIAKETPEELTLLSLPFRDREVSLQVFRNSSDGSYEVAIGTMREPICSLELWRMDISGRIIPIDTPEEPQINEFFARKRKFPPRIKHDIQICIGSSGLIALPIFWNDIGMLPARLDNEIAYKWTGEGFQKKIFARNHTSPAK